jgi:hypothetical protein
VAGRVHARTHRTDHGELDDGPAPSPPNELTRFIRGDRHEPGRSRAGSRRLPSLRQTIGQAACAASSATSRSPQITKQTRVMSSWWALMIRANAVSSPAPARATVPARLSSSGTTEVAIPHRCSGVGQVIQAIGPFMPPGGSAATGTWSESGVTRSRRYGRVRARFAHSVAIGLTEHRPMWRSCRPLGADDP